MPPVVTRAVRLPAVAGLVAKVTVIEVALAAVTSPTAPLLSVTLLLAAVLSKPKPFMTKVPTLAPRLAILLVTTGMTVATFKAEPLLRLFVVTTAVRLPAVVGDVESVMVNRVEVAVVTVPTAPSLNTTMLLAAMGSKPNPLMVKVVALAAKLALLVVTTGTIVATLTAVPLVMLLVVTTAVRLPALTGEVLSVTVRVVPVAEVTVPTAPLLKVTVLWLAITSKPEPLMVNDVTLAARVFELLACTTGITSAT